MEVSFPLVNPTFEPGALPKTQDCVANVAGAAQDFNSAMRTRELGGKASASCFRSTPLSQKMGVHRYRLIGAPAQRELFASIWTARPAFTSRIDGPFPLLHKLKTGQSSSAIRQISHSDGKRLPPIADAKHRLASFSIVAPPCERVFSAGLQSRERLLRPAGYLAEVELSQLPAPLARRRCCDALVSSVGMSPHRKSAGFETS